MTATDIVEKWVDPLGLMPDDELSMTLAINEAIAEAYQRGRKDGLEEAAKCAEAWPTNKAGHIWQEEIAAAIRSLMEKSE